MKFPFAKNQYRLKLWQTALAAVLLAGAYTLLCLWCQPNNFLHAGFYVLRQPLLIVLNALPVGLTIAAAAFALGNVFRGAAVGGTLWAVLSVINRIKIQVRDEPFFPRDIGLVKEAANAMTIYEVEWPWLTILVILGCAIALWVAGGVVESTLPRLDDLKHGAVRLMGTIAPLAAMAALVVTVYASNDLYNSFRTGNPYYVPQVFNELGFPYCFCHHFTTYTVEKPEGYDRSEAESWDNAGTAGGQGKAVHVIMVMNEGFSHLTEEPAFTYTAENDPMATYHALQESGSAFSGRLVVTSFAGGTANTEFDAVTGMRTQALSATTTSALRAVNGNLDSIFRVFGKDGYATSYVHPGDNWFYNRENVFRWMGADETLFVGEMENVQYKGRWVTDEYTAGLTLERFRESVERGEQVFSYVTTIQNHMSYTADKYGADYAYPPVETSADLSPEVETMLEVYIEGVRDADEMLRQLTEGLAATGEPVVLVFFGDHLPYLGDDRLAYRELGSEAALTEEDGSTAGYETCYLVWASDAAKDVLDWESAVDSLDLPEDGRLSACFLGQLVLELTGRGEDSAWFSWLGELRRELPVIGQNTCVTADGAFRYFEELTAEQRELIAKGRKWSYYKLKQKKIP